MFRLSFLTHPQVVTLGYCNIQLILLSGTRSKVVSFVYCNILELQPEH
jgi:hypothetical protein